MEADPRGAASTDVKEEERTHGGPVRSAGHPWQPPSSSADRIAVRRHAHSNKEGRSSPADRSVFLGLAGPGRPASEPAIICTAGGKRLEAFDPVGDFDTVYEHYRVRIYRAVFGVVLDEAAAEDLTQETFERAYRDRAEFRGSAPIGAWLHRIAINLAISHVRRRDLARQLPFRMFMQADSSVFDQVEDRTLIERALGALRPRQRAVVVLHFYSGMTREEIAAVLGLPEGTVASRLASGLKVMRRTLNQVGRDLAAGGATEQEL